ncbi:MAG: hypothetical protein C0436_04455, partial [Alphaproteobacteria bacterium]|nr:hypothetical protein [Alphaproteobacteria bacterium]
NGLTEIASIRGAHENGANKLTLFHSFILPLKPAYRDYVEAYTRAKSHGTTPPPYDRRLYEYDIEPAALAVTGTEIVRKRKDVPITGLKVDGKSVVAQPFYEIMDDFLAFTGHGTQDVYYNAPFDKPFLGALIADVNAHRLAHHNAHSTDTLCDDTRIEPQGRALLREFASRPYASLDPLQQAHITAALRAVAHVPDAYLNSALYQCLYYGFLARAGFGPSNTLDDATRLLVDATHTKRGDHSGIEDVVLAARVGLRLSDGGIRDMARLYERLLKHVDPNGHVDVLPTRMHRNGKEHVAGDIGLHFSKAPSLLGEDAERLWTFLAAFHEAPNINSRVPQHVLTLDTAAHRAVINAERKQPLSLNFLKKCIYFGQMLHSPLFYSMLPFDSTGNRMDVVLRARDPETGERITIRDVHYGSLRANTHFLEAHPSDAASYLKLIERLRNIDRSVGMVLFRPTHDGGVDIVVKGHLRAFGECVMHLPKGVAVSDAIPSITRELSTQIKLGVIPQVGYFGEPDDERHEDDEDELATNPHTDRREDRTSRAFVDSRSEGSGRDMSLTLSQAAFACVAHRLEKTPEALLSAGLVQTGNGPIRIIKHKDGRIILGGHSDAFYDFIELGSDGEVGEKPSNLIRDASWLLYRLERIPGTYGITIAGDMAILDQRDGVSVEALGLLHYVGIPFKAYDTSIKVDVHQLMKNAFHWSLALSRAQKQRKNELDTITRSSPLSSASVHSEGKGYIAPPRFMVDVQHALLSGKAQALEMNEQRSLWLLDHPSADILQPQHHAIEKHPGGITLSYRKKALVIEESNVKGPQAVNIIDIPQGNTVIHASPVLLSLAGSNLKDTAAFSMSAQDAWNVPASQRKQAVDAAYMASRFLYGITKATGSERLAVRDITIEDDTGRVVFHMPSLPFIPRTGIYNELMTVHNALAKTMCDEHIRHLQRTLPDPRVIDRREGDVMQLTSNVWQQLNTLDALCTTLNGYLKLLGGAEHQGDPASFVFSDELRDDLSTLGMLLHERASSLRKNEGKSPAWKAIHTAQEKLSAVAFGSDQLREDLAVARKTLNGGVHGDGGLRARIGAAMGTVMGEAACELARYDLGQFSADSMELYRTHMLSLLGNDEAAYRYHARHAAMRYLMQLPHAQDPVALQDSLSHYFLGEAFPAFSSMQRQCLITLYREGSTPNAIAGMKREFRESGRRAATPHSDWLIDQHRLLTQPEQARLSREAWRQQRPEAMNDIEADITAAYQRRGRLYLDMAFIVNPHSNEAGHTQDDYIARAQACLLRAGWTQEKFNKALDRTRTRVMSVERKQHVRAQISYIPDTERRTIKDMLATIDEAGHEEWVRDAMEVKAYEHYRRDAAHKIEDFLDPYFMHKQRVALLNDITKALKETHDLLMVKYHHVRDLQGLLVLLQQDPLIADTLNEDAQARIQEIGNRISHKPEMAGIHEHTLPDIHDEIAHQHEQLRTHLIQHLESRGIPCELRRDGTVTCDIAALKHGFAAWKQAHNTSQTTATKPLPTHIYPWLERAAQRLFRIPYVEAVSLDKQIRGVTCRVHLPNEHEARVRAWAELRLATTGLGVMLPPMPTDIAPSHTIIMRLSRRAERGIINPDYQAGAHELRHAIGAFAVAQGLPEAQESAFVARVMKRSRKPNALQDALLKSASNGGDILLVTDALKRGR